MGSEQTEVLFRYFVGRYVQLFSKRILPVFDWAVVLELVAIAILEKLESCTTYMCALY